MRVNFFLGILFFGSASELTFKCRVSFDDSSLPNREVLASASCLPAHKSSSNSSFVYFLFLPTTTPRSFWHLDLNFLTVSSSPTEVPKIFCRHLVSPSRASVQRNQNPINCKLPHFINLNFAVIVDLPILNPSIICSPHLTR